jgi:hypothetical protein
MCHQCCAGAKPRRRGSSFAAGMATADHDDIEIIWLH